MYLLWNVSVYVEFIHIYMYLCVYIYEWNSHFGIWLSFLSCVLYSSGNVKFLFLPCWILWLWKIKAISIEWIKIMPKNWEGRREGALVRARQWGESDCFHRSVTMGCIKTVLFILISFKKKIFSQRQSTIIDDIEKTTKVFPKSRGRKSQNQGCGMDSRNSRWLKEIRVKEVKALESQFKLASTFL